MEIVRPAYCLLWLRVPAICPHGTQTGANIVPARDVVSLEPRSGFVQVQRNAALEVRLRLALVDGVVRDDIVRGVVERQPSGLGRDRHSVRDRAFALLQEIARLAVLREARRLFDPLAVSVLADLVERAAFAYLAHSVRSFSRLASSCTPTTRCLREHPFRVEPHSERPSNLLRVRHAVTIL
jgi:hypothetical protein